MPKINNLRTNQKNITGKSRPLKIICDWDETIQPLKPILFFEGRKGIEIPPK